MVAMENFEAKTMRKQTKSIPRSLMVAKLGGPQALSEAVKAGEVMEVKGPSGCKTSFFAFTSYTMAEERGIAKRRKMHGSESITFQDSVAIEDALTSMNITFDIAGKEEEPMSQDTTKLLQDTLKSGNALVGTATSAVMQSLDEDLFNLLIAMEPNPIAP